MVFAVVVLGTGLYYSVSRSSRGCCYLPVFCSEISVLQRPESCLGCLLDSPASPAADANADVAAAPATAICCCCRRRCYCLSHCSRPVSRLQFLSSCSFCATFLRDCLSWLRLRSKKKSKKQDRKSKFEFCALLNESRARFS